MTKVFVIGGAGFIGHHVVALLNEMPEIEVGSVDNHSDYGMQLDPFTVDKLMDQRTEFSGVDSLYCEARDYGQMQYAMDRFRPDIVIYSAGYPRSAFVDNNPKGAMESMLKGLENALSITGRYDSSRFVYLSSSMVYGNFDEPVDEDALLNPRSLYAAYKVAGEELVKLYAERGEFEYTIIRPSAVYGPRDITQRVVGNMFLTAFMGKAIQVHGAFERLDFSYVEDVAAGIVKATFSENGKNEIFNITRGEGRTLLGAAEIIRDIVGGNPIQCINANPKMPSRNALDIGKAQILLNYQPKVDIEEGFKYYYDWLNASTI